MSTKPAEESPTPPSASLMRRLESAGIDIAAKLLDMPTKPKAERYRELTPDEEKKLREIEKRAITEFEGDIPQLEAALGMLRMGHQYGWKVLYLVHSKKTVRRYEEILTAGGKEPVRVRDLFDETGPSSYRSVGFALAQRFSNFWKVAGGDISIPKRKDSVNQ